MNRSSQRLLGSLLLSLPLLVGAGCKNRAERVESELGDAGYTLTHEDWFRASASNDLAALEQFVAAGFPADTRDSDQNTALHAAAAAGAEGAADFLLRRGLPVDVLGANDQTPLMSAVIANQAKMTGWLLRQGADPKLQNAEGFKPLMLAVQHNSTGSIAELAPYSREDLDYALLLAALLGRAEAIDMLTNYGASVYARMADGRTALMVAAENGHEEAVQLLVEIGASRFATDDQGLSAADHAREAGHEDLIALILREPMPDELALETPEEIASDMVAYVDAAAEAAEPSLDSPTRGSAPTEVAAGAPPGASSGAPSQTAPSPPPALEGQRLGGGTASAARPVPADPAREGTASAAEPPLVMRHYRAREMPIEIGAVDGPAVTIRLRGIDSQPVQVAEGDVIPGTRLQVVQIHRRMEASKVNPSQRVEVSIVEVEDPATGSRREWRSGLPASAHDPVALVEDAATGKRYLAVPGQRFTGADGTEYVVADVRPNQLVVEDAAGEVQTIALSGPRG